MTLREICKAARLLNCKTHLHRHYTLDEETTGILSVEQLHVPHSRHVVYVWEGRVLEPKNDRRELWLDVIQFLCHYKYDHDALITVEAV